ncbi:MAG: transposase [Deltaproteobacteria bacterium]|nr:transposase [Deltaproteobacteria bacterium]
MVRFKRPWEDGTCGLLLSPLELIERLAALVLSPRAHRVHYHGVFAPAASWRRAIVPTSPARERRCLRPKGARTPGSSQWYPWADLLWRVLARTPSGARTAGASCVFTRSSAVPGRPATSCAASPCPPTHPACGRRAQARPQPDPHPQDAHIRRPRSRAPRGGLTESNLRTQARFR